MRAFLVLFGTVLLVVSIVLTVLGFLGKIPKNIGLVVLVLSLLMVEIGRKYF